MTGNAIKFTSAGEVMIRVSLVEGEGVQKEIGDRQEIGDRVLDSGRVLDSENMGSDGETVLLRFSVRDTGIGIQEDKIGLLFEKFSQVDASTTRRYGGTGLGLAISRQLAELMNGEAGASSEEGKGSEFWFTARLGKQAVGSQAESIPPADLCGVRVLIVEDSATNREILSTRLASWGMRPTEVQDGPEALQALYRALDENDPFRIAVIDMQMPGMDGETLGRAIQTNNRLNDTRMVMMTSLGIRGDARRFQEIGFAAYTTKPIHHQALMAVLSLTLTERNGTKPQPIATRHTAREKMSLFAGRKARILLAEDNITNQQVALGILKIMGLYADVVANGVEALKAIETLPYDLVLMDVQMPQMDGLEATKRIRNYELGITNDKCGMMNKEEPATDDSPSKFKIQNSSFAIPIIAMTAHTMKGDRERCLEAGMNDYIAKPVSPQALAEVLEKWLPKENDDRCTGMMKKKETEKDASHSLLIFDRAGMMTRLMDNEKLARTVVEGFIEDIPLQIEALRGYLETGDAVSAERQAHTIKGASANVGGESLRAAALEMEKLLKAGDINAINACLTELKKQFDLLSQAMKKEM
jgi:CheY-like chemotaxis protein/HPt (histidine-containing phosphotransfer) domain-containing protein